MNLGQKRKVVCLSSTNQPYFWISGNIFTTQQNTNIIQNSIQRCAYQNFHILNCLELKQTFQQLFETYIFLYCSNTCMKWKITRSYPLLRSAFEIWQCVANIYIPDVKKKKEKSWLTNLFSFSLCEQTNTFLLALWEVIIFLMSVMDELVEAGLIVTPDYKARLRWLASREWILNAKLMEW